MVKQLDLMIIILHHNSLKRSYYLHFFYIDAKKKKKKWLKEVKVLDCSVIYVIIPWISREANQKFLWVFIYLFYFFAGAIAKGAFFLWN